MTDIERRLRAALDASVADAQLPMDAMNLVRRQHRRRHVRLAAASVLAVAAVIAVVVSVGPLRPGADHKPATTGAGSVFPGGGRILVADGSSLKWVNPDGQATRIAVGFVGAETQGTHLVAWKGAGTNGLAYYTMNIDGSAAKLILPAETQQQYLALTPKLAPDGSQLVYIRQEQLPNGGSAASLWRVDLATGRRHSLGPVMQSDVAWKDDTTVLAATADSKSLVSINVDDASRTTYMSVNDQNLVRAYKSAHPTAGPPAFIHSDGFSPVTTPQTLAVWVAAISPDGSFTQPAEALISRGHISMFAPPTPQQLDFTWGPKGTFVLRAGVAHGPTFSKAYAGAAGADRLSAPYGTSNVGSAAINPQGTVMALQDDDIIRFASITARVCNSSGHCPGARTQDLTGRGPTLAGQGTIVTWQP
jgi:hypothetical protein